MVKKATTESLDRALQEMHEVGQGVLVLACYDCLSFVPAFLAGRVPEADALLIEGAISILNRPGGGSLCLLCENEIGGKHLLPRAFVILRPELEAIEASARDGCDVVVNGICHACFGPGLAQRMEAYYREMMGVTMMTRIHHDASGHA